MNRNWIEDFDHDNGCYENACVSCRATFFGHKRRVTCKICVALATATSKIEALEAKLAAAERLRQTMRSNLFAIYDGTWKSSGCVTIAAFAGSCLERIDNEVQKENTDA